MDQYRTVVFDCDSTLSALEGIEHLAADHRAEVAVLTDAAMQGDVPLDEVYGRRLALIRPSRAAVDSLIPRYVEGLVADAAATVAALRASGVDVRVISGGLLPAVAGLARHLGLQADAVAAVPLRFDDDGAYAGFDETAPPARANGKAEVIRRWREAGLAGPVMFVGDGATDLEARDEVDLFVAYAGVVERPAVVAAAPLVIRSPSLAPVLPLALGDRRPAGPDDAALYDRGRDLINEGMVQWR
ncbi:MAG: HAD-IB family phosphatase [Gemmatimonadota bacterium]